MTVLGAQQVPSGHKKHHDVLPIVLAQQHHHRQ